MRKFSIYHLAQISLLACLIIVTGMFKIPTGKALALATKVANSPYTIAELCWSDDPEYVTGYVSNHEIGYVRITPLKREGCESGGRIFFVSDEVELRIIYTLFRKRTYSH
ncbi:6-carboxyhexanoate--CoA ligase [Lysinibacillus sphaericus]